MSFKHKSRSLLSIPMGISAGIHALLMVGLTLSSWEKPIPKAETPPIKITNILLEQEKMFSTTRQKTTKRYKENPKPLKASPFFQPVSRHTSPVSRKVPAPVKPSIPTSDNMDTRLQIQPVVMISNTVQRPLSSSTYTASRPSLKKKITVRKVTGELIPSLLETSPTPSVQTVERSIPVSRTHPAKITAIPSNFVDEESKKVFQASTPETSGHLAKKTDPYGQDLESIRKGFSSNIRGRIAQAKYYPSIAKERGWEGEPVIEFTLARNGDLLNASIVLASPHKSLDEAALDAIKNAAPYPKIPESLGLDSTKFKLPISFILNEP